MSSDAPLMSSKYRTLIAFPRTARVDTRRLALIGPLISQGRVVG